MRGSARWARSPALGHQSQQLLRRLLGLAGLHQGTHHGNRAHAGAQNLAKLRGANAAQALETLVPVDIIDLPVGLQRYAMFTDENGGKATVTIADESGRELGAYQLSKEFGEFNVVQLGSIMHGDNGWEYAPVGRGFTGTFNDVLGHFS